jgi:hypothetical protein
MSFTLLIKLKYNQDHIHGFNWVLEDKLKILKIHYMVIRSFAKFVPTERGRPPKMIQVPNMDIAVSIAHIPIATRSY